jgi:hypothetical protein
MNSVLKRPNALQAVLDKAKGLSLRCQLRSPSPHQRRASRGRHESRNT